MQNPLRRLTISLVSERDRIFFFNMRDIPSFFSVLWGLIRADFLAVWSDKILNGPSYVKDSCVSLSFACVCVKSVFVYLNPLPSPCLKLALSHSHPHFSFPPYETLKINKKIIILHALQGYLGLDKQPELSKRFKKRELLNGVSFRGHGKVYIHNSLSFFFF